ncbi:DUF4167 domain-containing protein [Sphingorhabdus sp. Alg231-15]|uniref:DUF4167 domain-containing protein n=1 Tax=Sphingorhabdus sp. Alg231-15 TaxID=1922222 RepID=UPI003FD634F2
MNNRQAGGRRRGRNNNSNRNQGNRGGGGVDRDNRIDNRARGNAAQMLDKYKKMAQDAQVNGDRVNAEYYHQFADHYFRVNADSQARREEQRLAREEQRNQNADRDDRPDQDDGDRQDRNPRGRQQRDRGAKPDNAQDTAAPAGQEDGQTDAPAEKKPVRARRPRKPAAEVAETNGESNGLDASALPPAISIKSDDGADGEAEKKPVRKRRTVKAKAAETETAQEGDAA